MIGVKNMMNDVTNFGIKKYKIGNVEIEFNPTDLNIMERIEQAAENMKSKAAELSRDFGGSLFYGEAHKKFDAYIREQIDFAFNADISNKLFQNVSSVAYDGKSFYFEVVIQALIGICEAETKSRYRASPEVQKYIKSYNGKRKKRRK